MLALCWHSPEGPFRQLALGLTRVAKAAQCDESCVRTHAGHGCEHEGHACGCPHSGSYDFDWTPSGEVAERWSESALTSLLQFLGRLDCDQLSADEIESRLEWWWRGENHQLRRALQAVHRRYCERGRGVLINRATGEVRRARCKSWRECEYCAWVYGRSVERLFSQVKGLRAFIVFTMPAELGDWSNREHIKAQARAKRRLNERLFRKFGRRFSHVWAREHNTKSDGPGRLHLNVLWDADWVDQEWLSEAAHACGFGKIVHISRIGRNSTRYATKCLRYASKELSGQADWPKGTRRHGASRAARAQMHRPARNPDWFFALEEPPNGFLPGDVGRYKRERTSGCICCLCYGKGGHGVAGRGCFVCVCGSWELNGCPRTSLSHEERVIAAARASPD